MLAIAFFVGEGGPSYFAFTAMLAFLSIVHAIPYVTRGALVGLTCAAIAVIGAVGISGRTAAESPSSSSICAASPRSRSPRSPRKSWSCSATFTRRWAGS